MKSNMKYIAPQLTVVEFKVERGFANSLNFDPTEFESMTLQFDSNGDGNPDKNIEDYTVINNWDGHEESGNWFSGGNGFF